MKKWKEISIRRACAADAVKIRNLHVKSIRELCDAEYSQREIDAWSAFRKAQVYRDAMNAGEKIYVAVLNEKILGFSAFRKNQLRALYVHPRYVRRGIGRRLLHVVEKSAKKIGFRSIFLNSSLTAIPFYIQEGYRAGKRITRPLSNGVVLQARRMTKLL